MASEFAPTSPAYIQREIDRLEKRIATLRSRLGVRQDRRAIIAAEMERSIDFLRGTRANGTVRLAEVAALVKEWKIGWGTATQGEITTKLRWLYATYVWQLR